MTNPAEARPTPPEWPLALLCLCGGLFSLGVAVLTVVEDWLFASAYLSQSTWQALVIDLGGQLETGEEGAVSGATLGSPGLVLLTGSFFGCSVWAIGSWLAARLSGQRWGDMASTWAVRGGRWLFLLLLWSQGRLIAFLLGADWLHVVLATTSDFYWAIVFGLVAWEWWPLTRRPLTPLLETPTEADERFARRLIWGAFAVYSLVYVAMNWGLWFNLRIPHGDSAMYEEHLWNLTHGKGFRSYLDQGLFLGEHIQVIHLALLPLYLVWPSHLLLELCQSLGIAAVVFPLYSIARRHTGQPRLAAGVAVLGLLAFPLHYLDISIDVKTFRPTAFGVVIVLAAIDAFEAKRFRWMLAWVLLGLSAQEDFSLALGPLGLWFAWDGWRKNDRSQKWLGLGLLVGSAAYLLLVMKVLLPYFRAGVTIHYASYFAKFGQTPGEILWTMLTQPGLVWESLVTASSLYYALCLLVPLGLLPLLSPSRLLTAAPLFVLLCLNELALNPPGPFHHFHAPILPLLLWAAAAGLGRSGGSILAFSLTCGVWTCLVFSHSPLSFKFWDSGKPEYWLARYLPDERHAQFAKIANLIPVTAKVASTDFVHPRYTHFERSYDYSKYPRRVNGNRPGAPPDTEYIVIDTRHPYSWVHGPEDVRELQTEPEKWELLPDRTEGYFLVLKRRQAADAVAVP
jgi:uncharacterized membrane protein